MSKRKSVSKRTRFEIFKRDKFTCAYCGRTPPGVLLEIDHIIAVKNGGDNSEQNLVTSCEDCNAGKSSVPLNSIPTTHAPNLVKEREKLEQLKAISQLSLEQREQSEIIFRIVSDAWLEREGEDSAKFVAAGNLALVIRRFLKLLPLGDVLEAVEITFERLSCHYRTNRIRYFCGVCYRTMREKYGIQKPIQPT